MEKGVWPQGAQSHPALREAVNTTGTSVSTHTHTHTQSAHTNENSYSDLN